MTMIGFVASFALMVGGIPVIESKEYSKSVQTDVVLATVCISQPKRDFTGSGVLLYNTNAVAYVLTADHVVAGVEIVEVTIFTSESYPKSAKTLSARVVSRQNDNNQDLALLR